MTTPILFREYICCDFELKLKLTSDFKAKLLSRGEWIEIMEPKALADEIIEWHQKAIDRYKVTLWAESNKEQKIMSTDQN